jgi:hypothetical protein
MIKSLKELSQILIAAGISSSQEEKILIAVKNLSASPHLQEDLEVSFDPSCQSIEETKESCITIDGEQPLEPEIKEFQTCLPKILYAHKNPIILL